MWKYGRLAGEFMDLMNRRFKWLWGRFRRREPGKSVEARQIQVSAIHYDIIKTFTFI